MKLKKEFPQLVSLSDIGLSYQGLPIHMIILKPKSTSNTGRKGVLFTGAHHARELSSISMCLSFMLKMTYGYFINDTTTMSILDSTTLYIIPIVNIDGFKYISDKFH